MQGRLWWLSVCVRNANCKHHSLVFSWFRYDLRSTQQPFTKCVMADDFLIYFFVALKAGRYCSVMQAVYRYDIGTGISSHRKITTLSQWEKICSAANVFTVLFDAISRLPFGTLSKQEYDKIRVRCRYYLTNNIRQLRETVVPNLQADARAMLSDYWGEDFVKEIEFVL